MCFLTTIPEKESESVEFKSVPASGLSEKTVIEAVVAMANTEGGFVYLGIDDDGTPTGIRGDDPRWLDPVRLKAVVADNTVPPLNVSVHILQPKKGVNVTVVHVPKTRGITTTRTGKALKRRIKFDGTLENAILYHHQDVSVFSDMRDLDFTYLILPGTTTEDLDSGYREALRNIIRENKGDSVLLELDDEAFDLALQLVRRDDQGQIRPTVCGLLLIGRPERLKVLLPSCEIVFQYLRGDTVLQNQEVELPLVKTFAVLLEKFRMHTIQTDEIRGLGSVRLDEISEKAFREALINAFCHRDYAKLGRLSVRFTTDGIDITSPGGFVHGVTLDNLLIVEPAGRNPCLANAFNRIGLAERTGRGVDRIFRESIRYGRLWPDYSETTSEYVRVCLPKAKVDVDFSRFVNEIEDKLQRTTTVGELMVISLLHKHGAKPFEFLASRAVYPPGRLEREIDRLVAAGIVYQTAEGDFAIKRVAQKTETGPVRPLTEVEKTKRKIEELVAARGMIQRNDVVEHLGIDSQKVYLLLRAMVLEGRLIAQGSNRARKYVLP